MWKTTDGETPVFETAAFLMCILTLTNYQNKTIQLVTFFIFHIFFGHGKYQFLIKLATFAWGFQLSTVTNLTAINFFARVSNTAWMGQILSNTEKFRNSKMTGDNTQDILLYAKLLGEIIKKIYGLFNSIYLEVEVKSHS